MFEILIGTSAPRQGRMEKVIASNAPQNRAYIKMKSVGGRLYGCGGWNGVTQFRDMFSYSKSENIWRSVTDASMTFRHSYSMCTNVNQDYIYVLFGADASQSNSSQRYSVLTNSVDFVVNFGSQPGARQEALVERIGAQAYMFGGWLANGQLVNDTWRWADLGSGSWSNMNPVNPPPVRRAASSVENGGKMYVIGGQGPTVSGPVLKDFWVYDPQVNTWTRLEDLPVALRLTTAAVVNNKIYVFGGLTDTGVLSNRMFVYDLSTGHWAELPVPDITPRFGMGVAAMDGQIWYYGGYISTTEIVNDLYRFTPA